MEDTFLKLIYYHPTEAGKSKRRLLNLPEETDETRRTAFQQNQGNIVQWGNECTNRQNSVAGIATGPQNQKWFQAAQGVVQLDGWVNKPYISVAQVLADKDPNATNVMAGTSGHISNLLTRVGPVMPYAVLTPEQGEYADANVGLYAFNTDLDPNDPLSARYTRGLFDVQNSRLANINTMTTEQRRALRHDENNKRNRQMYDITTRAAERRVELVDDFAERNAPDPTRRVNPGGMIPIQPLPPTPPRRPRPGDIQSSRSVRFDAALGRSAFAPPTGPTIGASSMNRTPGDIAAEMDEDIDNILRDINSISEGRNPVRYTSSQAIQSHFQNTYDTPAYSSSSRQRLSFGSPIMASQAQRFADMASSSSSSSSRGLRGPSPEPEPTPLRVTPAPPPRQRRAPDRFTPRDYA